jgi:hypothetical protein
MELAEKRSIVPTLLSETSPLATALLASLKDKTCPIWSGGMQGDNPASELPDHVGVDSPRRPSTG